MCQKKIRLIFVLMAVITLLIPFHSTSSAQGVDRPFLKIVQIGDSYSAGNGARSASGEINYEGPSDCYHSPTNWADNPVVMGYKWRDTDSWTDLTTTTIPTLAKGASSDLTNLPTLSMWRREVILSYGRPATAQINLHSLP